MRSFERNMKAISPVLAVLMMIAVTIAGSLITYAWVTGYIGFTTDKAGQAIMIQSIAYNKDDEILKIYVQNVGEGVVQLEEDSSLYVNDALTGCGIDLEDGVVPVKATATLTVDPILLPVGNKVTVKVTTTLGTFTEKSTYPTSTTIEDTTPPNIIRVQDNTTGFVNPTPGNMLVVIAGHRSNFPGINGSTPTIDDWELQEVAYYQTGDETYDRRIVAIFTKIATGSEDTVSITWGDGSTAIFTLYQEFNATSFEKVTGGSGVNSEGIGPSTWAESPLAVPSSALSDPGGENILSIGAAVWRDGDTDITNPVFTELTGVVPGAIGTSCPGASAFSYGSAVTHTSVSWDGADTDDMVSGLLIQFAIS